MRLFLYCLFSGILGEIRGNLPDKKLCSTPDCSGNGEVDPGNAYPSPAIPDAGPVDMASKGAGLEDNLGLGNPSYLSPDTNNIPPPSPDALGSQQVDYNNIPATESADGLMQQYASSDTSSGNLNYQQNNEQVQAYTDGAYYNTEAPPSPSEAYSQSNNIDTDYASTDAVSGESTTGYTTSQPDDGDITKSDSNANVYTTVPDGIYATNDGMYNTPTGGDMYSQNTEGYNANLSDSGNQEDEASHINLPNSLPADEVNEPRGGLVGEEVLHLTEGQPLDHGQVGAGQLPDQPVGEIQQQHPSEEVEEVGFQHDHSDTPYTAMLMQFLPEWVHVAAHENGGVHGDRAVLLIIIAVTMLLVHLITSCVTRSGREKPLLAKLSELDNKLFQTTNELLILRKETSEQANSSGMSVSSDQVRELEIQIEQVNIEKDQYVKQVKDLQARSSKFEEEMYRAVSAQEQKEKEVEVYKQEKEALIEEARLAQEMAEEFIHAQNNNQSNDKLIELVQKLQKQLESQQDTLKQYEPRLKKKEKEARELNKEMKQLRADIANANLAKDKAERDLTDQLKLIDQHKQQLQDNEKNEEEWKSLSDLLQSQLDAKCEEFANIETEMASIKSRMSIFSNELEEKEEEVEVLQETIKELKLKKGIKKEDSCEDGWQVDADNQEDGWEVDDLGLVDEEESEESQEAQDNQTAETAKLKVAARRAVSSKKKIEEELQTINKHLAETKTQLDERESECQQLRSARDETVEELVETNRRYKVLEQFFNKKEAELQKQLGLQSARFGDVSSNADTTAKKLIFVTEELEATKSSMKKLKCELEEQEKSLKAAVALQEKKAHENWVAARQAERKLTDVQTEMSSMRNMLTVAESRASGLEQEKSDLQTTIQNIQQAKPSPESGPVSLNGYGGSSVDGSEAAANSLTDPASLPPLPGLPTAATLPTLPGLSLPAMMVPPAALFGPPTVGPLGLPGMPNHLLDSRPPPLGRMSPPRERERSDVSFRSEGGRDYSPQPRGGGRDYSPTSRSERRGGGRRHSPRRPSPTRSDRGYYRDSSTDRSFRQDDHRYDRRGSRDEYDRRSNYDEYDRRRNNGGEDFDRRRDYDSRSSRRGDDYFDRRGRDYLNESQGPKTSSPMESRNFVT